MREDYFDGVKIKDRARPKSKSGEFKGVHFKKSLGQNFLSNSEILNEIIRAGELEKDDIIIEIGAGAGTLTEILAQNAKKVISFEIDESLQNRLKILGEKYPNVEFRFEDFMKTNLDSLFDEGKKYKVVANIPYYITSPIIFKLLEYRKSIDVMIFMVQKEVAKRFTASCGDSDFSVSSIMLQSASDTEYIRTVPKEFFTPMPKVDSAILKVKINDTKYKIDNRNEFYKFVNNCFLMKRKTLINNLINSYSLSRDEVLDIFKKLNLNESLRPEDVTIDDYIKLQKLIVK